MRRLIDISILVLFISSVQAQNAIKSEYEKVEKALKLHCDEFKIDGTPESMKLLDRMWMLSAEWVSSNLNKKPPASIKDISVLLQKLGLSGEAIKLESDSLFTLMPSGFR
jgi:hypothetical protein